MIPDLPFIKWSDIPDSVILIVVALLFIGLYFFMRYILKSIEDYHKMERDKVFEEYIKKIEELDERRRKTYTDKFDTPFYREAIKEDCRKKGIDYDSLTEEQIRDMIFKTFGKPAIERKIRMRKERTAMADGFQRERGKEERARGRVSLHPEEFYMQSLNGKNERFFMKVDAEGNISGHSTSCDWVRGKVDSDGHIIVHDGHNNLYTGDIDENGTAYLRDNHQNMYKVKLRDDGHGHFARF